MPWIKKGLFFSPDNRIPWMQSHAQLPTLEHLEGDFYRIYFASRDSHKQSSIGYIEIDIIHPRNIIKISDQPILNCGLIGCFDEHGVLPASIVTLRGKKYLYYIGWHRGEHPELFYYSIGLAISDDGGDHFYRYSKAPIMSPSEYDPCLVTAPFVFIEDDLWKMFYVSGFKWEKNDERHRPYYHIKYAYSKDGIRWIRNGDIAIDFKDKDERNIARTWVVKDANIYRAWYCYASLQHKYRIGHAESIDGIHFERKDESVGIDLSSHGFDSEMMCYPCVFTHNRNTYMLYNGNNFGKDGIGLAVLERERK